MDYKKVGKCIIINNKNFEDKTGNVLSLMMLITDNRIFILSSINKYSILGHGILMNVFIFLINSSC